MIPYLVPFVLCVLGAFAYDAKGGAISRDLFWPILVLVAVLGGIRYQTGYDWLAYERLFGNIPVRGLGGLLGRDYEGGLVVEPGFYALNYVVKSVGGTIHVVFIVASAFNAWAVGRLLKSTPGNGSAALAVYVGYCLIYSHFSVVRQSIAVGFVYLACRDYIGTGKLIKPVLLVALGMSFQISCVLYLAIILLSRGAMTASRRAAVVAGALAVAVAVPLSWASSTDLTENALRLVLRLFGPDFFQKFLVYVGLEHTISPMTYGLVGLNCAFALFVFLNPSNEEKSRRVQLLAINATLLLIFAILLFPSNSLVWTRTLLVATPLQGLWLAGYLVRARFLHRLFAATAALGAAATVYVFLLVSNRDYLVPYQTVVHAWLHVVDPKNARLGLPSDVPPD